MSRSPSLQGFTLLEVLFVVVIAVVTLSIAAQVYTDYLERTAAERAARIFSRDLTVARMNAIQTRGAVVVRFLESDREYRLIGAGGETLVRRSYGEEAEVELGEIDLAMSGDSLVFNGRGIADLSNIEGSLGTAFFRAGGTSYTVSFNSMGASRIDD